MVSKEYTGVTKADFMVVSIFFQLEEKVLSRRVTVGELSSSEDDEGRGSVYSGADNTAGMVFFATY